MNKEETINVTLTLPVSQVQFLDEQAKAVEGNRSQAVRQIIREKMETEVVTQ